MESIFDPEGLKQQLAELEAQLNDPLIWDDTQRSTLVTTKAKKIKKEIQEYDYLQTELIMLAEMTDLFNERMNNKLLLLWQILNKRLTLWNF